MQHSSDEYDRMVMLIPAKIELGFDVEAVEVSGAEF